MLTCRGETPLPTVTISCTRAATTSQCGHGRSRTLCPLSCWVSGLLPLLLGTERLTLLLLLEVLVGGCYLVLMARELRHLRHPMPHHEPIAWLELAAAGILALEGYHIWHRHHEHNVAAGTHTLHVLPWLYALAAGLFVGLAFGANRLLERRFLHLHPAGFYRAGNAARPCLPLRLAAATGRGATRGRGRADTHMHQSVATPAVV